MQMLEERGLVTKRPAIMKGSHSNFFSSHISTNLVHLMRFAPDRRRDIRFTVIGCGAWRCLADGVGGWGGVEGG
jgi:hypothetical protein